MNNRDRGIGSILGGIFSVLIFGLFFSGVVLFSYSAQNEMQNNDQLIESLGLEVREGDLLITNKGSYGVSIIALWEINLAENVHRKYDFSPLFIGVNRSEEFPLIPGYDLTMTYFKLITAQGNIFITNLEES